MKSVLITRPEPHANAFAATLPAGWQPVISPLLKVVETGVIPDLSGIDGLIFTSFNGVQAAQDHIQDCNIPAWCVGQRTGEAARKLGLKVHTADGDVSSLQALVAKHQPSKRMLHIRGKHSAGDIASQLAKDGIKVNEVVLYNQEPLHLTAEAKAGLRNGRVATVVLFSPRTARIFSTETTDIDLHGIRLLCLSRNVAEALGEPLGACIKIAIRPDREAMLDLIDC